EVDVVTAEWHRAAAELLPVGIARRVAEPLRGRPGQAYARGAIRIEGCTGHAARAVAEWPLWAVARIVPAVPPDGVHQALVDRDCREPYTPGHRRIGDAGAAGIAAL